MSTPDPVTGPGRRVYEEARKWQALKRRMVTARGGSVSPRRKRRPPNWSPAAFNDPTSEVGQQPTREGCDMSIDDRSSMDAFDNLEKQRKAEFSTLHDLLSSAEASLSGPPAEFTRQDHREVKAIIEAASALIRHWAS